MADKSRIRDEESEFRFPAGEIDGLRSQTRSFVKQRLILWTVRWAIGFGLIWLSVSIWPQLSWLWWVGVSVALASLAILLGSKWLIARRFDQTTDRIRQAEAEIIELEQEALDGSQNKNS